MSIQIRLHCFALLFIFSLMSVSLATAEASEVSVQLKEFQVIAAPLTVRAGKVRFVAVNRGKDKHELVVRIKENGKYRELGEIEPFPPGVAKDIVLNLSPGTYELSCQLVEMEKGGTEEHYKEGMRVEIKVE